MSQLTMELLPKDCYTVTFSSVNPAALLPLRSVCRSWNLMILDDPRWKKFTNLIKDLIKDSKISGNDFVGLQQSNLYFIKQFCITVTAHFPDLFSKASEVFDDMPASVAKLDKALVPLKNNNISVEENKYMPLTLIHAFSKWNHTLNSGFKDILAIADKMRFIGFAPDFSNLHILLDLATEKEPEKIPGILELMSQARCSVEAFILITALLNEEAHQYIPQLITAMLRFRGNKLTVLREVLDRVKYAKEQDENLSRVEQTLNELVDEIKKNGATFNANGIEHLFEQHPEHADLICTLLEYISD